MAETLILHVGKASASYPVFNAPPLKALRAGVLEGPIPSITPYFALIQSAMERKSNYGDMERETLRDPQEHLRFESGKA